MFITRQGMQLSYECLPLYVMECQDTASKGVDVCLICRRKHGICIKVGLQSTFHVYQVLLFIQEGFLVFKVSS